MGLFLSFMFENQIKQEFKSLLSDDEQILWVGKPPEGILFRRSDIFLIPFTFLWFGFAIFWESIVLLMDAPWFFKLWGIPFVIFGFHICIGRFFIDSYRRKNTVYAITNERILIKSGIFSKEVNSINPDTLPEIGFTVKSNGSGTIVLGAEKGFYVRKSMLHPFGIKTTPRLELIPNAKRVYDIIIENQHKR